ncbi:hypothetical protein Fmac_001654 [Flemingia macrophylla]|uniref:Uncharacterized protein n=1 Tax=Flemingia macrophylla TaxID=520843 RepID=A0ABD1NHR7_9FABA
MAVKNKKRSLNKRPYPLAHEPPLHPLCSSGKPFYAILHRVDVAVINIEPATSSSRIGLRGSSTSPSFEVPFQAEQGYCESDLGQGPRLASLVGWIHPLCLSMGWIWLAMVGDGSRKGGVGVAVGVAVGIGVARGGLGLVVGGVGVALGGVGLVVGGVGVAVGKEETSWVREGGGKKGRKKE